MVILTKHLATKVKLTVTTNLMDKVLPLLELDFLSGFAIVGMVSHLLLVSRVINPSNDQ